jgi:serine/threonine-protein kinase
LRLRASALILLIGFCVFLLRHIVGALTDDLFEPWLLAFHLVVVLVEGVMAVGLSWQRIVSTRRLRVAEIVIFGLPAVFFLALQHQSTLFDVERGFMPPPSPTWLLLIFTYAMFIPNTWRRAAVVIGDMALAPLLLTTAMMLGYPAVARVISLADIVQHVLTLVIAAIAAVFGTHLINALRREAFEARQLGQYRLIERLGAGGMGEVYLAEHRMLKRPCAIKLIRPDKAGNPQALARFEREVRMTAGLSHWNTIEIFDYGRTEDGTFYYVMEYLPGLSLETLLDRHGPLPAERVIHFLRQVCGGLREAHSIGLIHRDIKPGNIFAAQRGGLCDVAKLLDFGLVKSVAEQSSKQLTRDGAISGTPLFMSPEQAQGGQNVDARSDIYSLGAVGYALLTGRPPFEAPSAMEVIVAHARDEVTPPSLLQADVPPDLERVILRCLAKRPEDRFQDAESLEQALAECGSANRWTQSHALQWWNESRREVAQPFEANVVSVH